MNTSVVDNTAIAIKDIMGIRPKAVWVSKNHPHLVAEIQDSVNDKEVRYSIKSRFVGDGITKQAPINKFLENYKAPEDVEIEDGAVWDNKKDRRLSATILSVEDDLVTFRFRNENTGQEQDRIEPVDIFRKTYELNDLDFETLNQCSMSLEESIKRASEQAVEQLQALKEHYELGYNKGLLDGGKGYCVDTIKDKGEIAMKEEIKSSGYKLIGIHGLAQSGKDKVGKFLLKELGDTWNRGAFADVIKDMLNAMGVDTSDNVKDSADPYYNISVRKMMQTLGNDFGRALDEDIWIKAFQKRNPSGKFVMTDVRRNNESDFIRNSGGFIIHVKGRGGIDSDCPSEGGIDFKQGDVVLDNSGTLEMLHLQLNMFIKGLQYGGAYID